VVATRYTVCIHLCRGLTLGCILGVGPRYTLISFVMFVCPSIDPHASTRLPLHEVSLNRRRTNFSFYETWTMKQHEGDVLSYQLCRTAL
jgi:hypothetical protein